MSVCKSLHFKLHMLTRVTLVCCTAKCVTLRAGFLDFESVSDHKIFKNTLKTKCLAFPLDY